MMNLDTFRNNIAEVGGDTTVNYSGSYVDVFSGSIARYKITLSDGTWWVDENQFPQFME